jgi:FKBP-type peptidyl-prolyl cis-trans isomerase FkpA
MNKTMTILAALALAGCAAQKEQTMSESKPESQPQSAAAPAGFPQGLKVDDQQLGDGAEAVAGKTISVHYAGRLITGKEFDSSFRRNEPFRFRLGAGQVIKGWDLGFAGMKVGGKRQLTIAPELGYGSRDMGVIPPNSTLVFDVELLGVE